MKLGVCVFDGSPPPLQLFQLIPTPQGSFYVLNDIFRLNYG